jgi:hypothetical protein
MLHAAVCGWGREVWLGGAQKPRRCRAPRSPPGPQGQSKEGVELLKRSLGCKYVAGDALKALNEVWRRLRACLLAAQTLPQEPGAVWGGSQS